jgi:hypothetical protein
LLDATKLGLDFGRNGQGGWRDTVNQGGIHDTAHRMTDRNLETNRPVGVEAADERLDHGCLESIDESWTDTREVAKVQVGAKRHAHRGQDLEIWGDPSVLDPGEVRAVDPDDGAELRQVETGVHPQSPDLVSDMVVQTAQPPRRLALYVGCCNEHRVIQSGRALRPLTDATTSHQIEVNAAVRARSIVGCDYQSRERRKGIQTGHWRPESRLLVAATRRGH